MRSWLATAALASAAIATFAGHGAGSPDAPHARAPISSRFGGARHEAAEARALQRYLARVEPIRAGVNRLLDGADPVLARYGRHRLGSHAAADEVRRLERRFAGYAGAVRRLAPVPRRLARAHRAYARTYLLEDAYLRALAAAIPSRRFGLLPRTEEAQRRAIVAWRRRLEAVAARLGVRLPAYVQVAGRGEIAPSPVGR